MSAAQPATPAVPPVHTLVTGAFELEDGTILPEVEQAYTLNGQVNEARDNVVLLLHSLTGSADPSPTWGPLIGPGRPLDTDRYAVLAPNLLGSCYGTTRPPTGARVTPRDMVRLVVRLVEALDIRSIALATGGSLGGMVALEWLAHAGPRTRAGVVFAAPAAHTAQAIAFNHIQRQAVQLGQQAGTDEAVAAGLGLARMAAMLTYRSAAEFEARFGRTLQDSSEDPSYFAIQSYLDHQGRKFVERFDPESYLTLLDTMDAHDLTRGREGVAEALQAFAGPLVGVGVTGDLLYAPGDVRRWVDAVPGAEYREIASLHGHDAFLLETEQVGLILREILSASESPVRTRGPNVRARGSGVERPADRGHSLRRSAQNRAAASGW